MSTCLRTSEVPTCCLRSHNLPVFCWLEKLIINKNFCSAIEIEIKQKAFDETGCCIAVKEIGHAIREVFLFRQPSIEGLSFARDLTLKVPNWVIFFDVTSLTAKPALSLALFFPKGVFGWTYFYLEKCILTLK